MYKNKNFIPVHEPDIDHTDYKSLLNTIKSGEISGSFTNTIKNLKIILLNLIKLNMQFLSLIVLMLYS